MARHLATRNPLRIGPGETRKIAGRPPEGPRPTLVFPPLVLIVNPGRHFSLREKEGFWVHR